MMEMVIFIKNAVSYIDITYDKGYIKISMPNLILRRSFILCYRERFKKI